MKQIKIGRSSDNDIVITDLKVSSHHCRVYESAGSFYVEDTGSLNGVKVNNVLIHERTLIEPESEIVIVSRTFTGDELIKAVLSIDTTLTKCHNIERKYDDLVARYQSNMRMLFDVLHIETRPYACVFESRDVEIEYYVKEYEKKMNDAISMFKLLSASSKKEIVAFHEDMYVLANLIKEAKPSNMREIDELKLRIYDKMMQLQKSINLQVNEVFSVFSKHYEKVFSQFYETCQLHSDKWKKIQNGQIISVPYVLIGYKEYDFSLFEQNVQIKQLLFVPFIKRNNLIVRYQSDQCNIVQNFVTSILGRTLASSLSGNVQIHMMDIKDLGGTSNILKLLDKHVYTISSRLSDVLTDLTRIDRNVEDVVQNLLCGPYNSLDQYNQGKENQEPYHIVVLKEFPYALTQEVAFMLKRIMENANRAGVYFVFMLNEDMLKHSEDCHKVASILHVDSTNEDCGMTIHLLEGSTDGMANIKYELLNDEQLYDIVHYVNAGFETKKDEILRLTDYMLPKNEWWSKHSASRVDIPFGMSVNKQIQKLNITQESGQNSAVVIGIPGSGKSVFLHVLIASAMVNYSPRELQMYLLDFSGVEFDVYARHKLPHARVIAPEAEREFGLSILREIYEEGNRRMTLCREYGVTNIVELKQKNPDIVVPRLLVIIDEFQKIFEIENDKISQEANSKIHAIIQEYRKFGINLILATQKLPARGVVPYDLIANRIVFKSDPNDFSNLIRWSHSTPQPRLQTGNCVYNNESGAEFSNHVARAFFINASNDLETLIDEVVAFAKKHPEKNVEQQLRTFRSDDLPEYTACKLSDRHVQISDIPKEVGVYMGESVAISPSHVYVPLTKDSNNNILIIGGNPNVAKGISYHSMLSAISNHTEQSCMVALLNFMVDDDPMQSMLQTDMYTFASHYSNLQEVKSAEDVLEVLKYIKEDVVDARKNDSSLPLTHFYINILEFQRGRMFDGVGSRGDMQSDCSRLLEYIMKNGPMVGVFTILQVDNLANLTRLGYSTQNLFCHRIALQMSEKDSNKVVDNSSANKLLVLSRPATQYRALYYNNINNSITKFKPYRYVGISD